MRGDVLSLFLCGDVMLGRGVDQILAHPGNPALREPYVTDARSYVEMAEAANGPIPRPVPDTWPWGDALRLLDEAAPDVRVINLETSVTRSDDFAPGKGVHYRMHPANLPCLAAVRPDVCVLANNHVLDFGRSGLTETLDTLAGAGLRTAGAGRDAEEARRPAAVPVGDGGRRVLVFSFGMPSSGIPSDWAASGAPPGAGPARREHAGVHLVPEASGAAARSAGESVAGLVARYRRPGDLAVVSVHWGSNWGYEVPPEQVQLAHTLIDGGVDVVHGHSSHHPRPVEVYRGRLVLYGCGDFVDDYEGISGYEEYRDDLRLLHLLSVEADTGRLAGLRMVPVQARRMRLQSASARDTAWLRATLDAACEDFGVRVVPAPDGALSLAPAPGHRAGSAAVG